MRSLLNQTSAGPGSAASPARLRARVVRKTAEAEGIASFELASAMHTPLPLFEPGAHVDIHVPGGPVRPYSLYRPADETGRYRIAVLREPRSRGGSAAMHEVLKPGDLIDIGAPRNQFALHTGGEHALLVAGGIGITPLLCMAEHLSREGAPFTLHYCSRSPGRAAFVDAIRASAWSNRAHFHFDDEPLSGRFDIGRCLDAAPAGAHLYACGPAGFMDAVLGRARECGWPDGRIHREDFAARAPDAAASGAFEVVLKSGRRVAVAANQTIAQALAAAGVDVPLSCEQGVCGTCLTSVVSGTPDHRDMYLTDEERQRNDRILLCCSRSRSAQLCLDI